MRLRLIPFSLLAAASFVSAQTGYNPPRMADGHPDLEGTYDIATLTPLERPNGAGPTLTKEQAARFEAQTEARRKQADAPLAADRSAPPVGGTGPGGGGGGKVGGYNYGWLDPGSTFNVVDGQFRSSIVIDPANGRIPPLTAAAQQRAASLRGQSNSDAVENDPDLDKTPGAYDDPERRPLGERCLLGFGSTSGPPALPDYMYNNLHRIVETKDYVMILTEMVHDARIVRMNSQHLPASIRKWNGDSIGHWEGDTLVVDTTNFTAKTRFRGSTENLHVVERFTRTGPRTLLYKFTVEDPATWARPWTGEMTWPLTDQHIYEYACHEANYALADILSGARLRDKEQAEEAEKKAK
ncbi:MAG TPA: hypothetical protein VEF06_08410 [Bryobacteraceae bacterium]|nr:hypothetical protein [Bryobacteraceae bacterium]